MDNQVFISGQTAIQGTYLIRLEEIGTKSANGGAISNSGTFQVSDYYNGTTFSPIGVYGNLSAVPLPAAVWMFGSGLAGLIGIRIAGNGKKLRELDSCGISNRR